MEAIGLKSKGEARQQYAKRQEKRFGRLEKNSLDEENQKRYAVKRGEWKKAGKAVANDFASSIISTETAKEVADVHIVGKIDREI